MSVQENEALVRWFFEEAWGKGNLAAVDEYIAADYVEHTLPPGSEQGRDALKQFVAMYHEAFPDVKVTMHDAFGKGDRVAYRWSASGTHLGRRVDGCPSHRSPLDDDGNHHPPYRRGQVRGGLGQRGHKPLGGRKAVAFRRR